jgi:serine/threonine-protein kinase
MPVQTTDSILADLRRVPLLTPDQFARVEATVRAGVTSPDKLVERLTEAGLLTRYQAEVIRGGQINRLAFGPYVLLDQLGEGGMGRVFKARHVRLGRVDALKVIRADKVASKVVARRFLREIRLTSSLAHPNVVRAYDAGSVGKQLYLATEYVSGKDLAATVRLGGPLSPAEACLAIYQAATALQHVHERGLVHRDVKPSNLIRDSATGTVKLLDLGLSGFRREVADESAAGTLTRDGMLLGTPDFMAPEQVHNPHGVDIRADLYSLGCSLFFLLTGKPPFDGTPVERMYKHSMAPIPPLVLPGRPTPPALAGIVARLMAKKPDDRFPTPQALIEALLALRRGTPGSTADVPAHSTPLEPAADPAADPWREQFEALVNREPSVADVQAPDRVRPRPNRAGWWVAGALAAALVLVGTLVAVLTRQRGATPQSTPTPPSPVVAPSPAVRPAAPTPSDPVADELNALRRSAGAADEDRAEARRRVLAFRAKYPHTPAATAAAALLRQLPSPLDRLDATPDPETRLPIVRRRSRGPAAHLVFAPDDERLLVAPAGLLEEWDAVTGQTTGSWKATGGRVMLTPDGRVAVTVDLAGRLEVCRRPADFRIVELSRGMPMRVVGVSADGRTAVVAFAAPDERLGVVNLDTGALTTRLDHRSVGVMFVAVSADGGTAAAVGADEEARVFAVTTGKQVQMHSVDLPRWHQPVQPWARHPVAVFGPDNRLYLTGVGGGAARFEPTARVAEAVYLLGDRVRPTCLGVSADGAAVAVGTYGGDVFLFEAATGKPGPRLTLGDPIRAVTFATSGRVLAAATESGAVVLVPLDR